jgi:hypothetical protein
MRGVTGFALGVAIVALLVPTAAVAVTLTYTGLKDANGDKALIGNNGQLYTTNAPPTALYNDGPYEVTPSTLTQIVTTPSGFAAIVSEVSVNETTLGSVGTDNVILELAADGSGGGGQCGAASTELRVVTLNGVGNSEITFPTGLVIPNGDALCAIYGPGTGTTPVIDVTASGYGVPTSEVS